jgi:DNA-binding PadR family transcriptional regulator
MFRFSMNGDHGRGCGPRGRGEFDPERFFHWVERLNGGERGRGGGGRRRMFDGGELRLVLLALIADEPRHGYDLIREIEERTGGAYAPSPGVVYPTLNMLADQAHIEEQASEGAKKRYAITAAGKVHLEENAETVARLMGRLAELGTMRERTDQWPVRRAMGNLRLSVRGRLMQGGGDATTHEIAALIDEVAQKIERLK